MLGQVEGLSLFCYPRSQLHSAELTSIWSWYGVGDEGAGGCLVLSHHTFSSTAQGTRQTLPLLGCELPSLVSTVPTGVCIGAMVSGLEFICFCAPFITSPEAPSWSPTPSLSNFHVVLGPQDIFNAPWDPIH